MKRVKAKRGCCFDKPEFKIGVDLKWTDVTDTCLVSTDTSD